MHKFICSWLFIALITTGTKAQSLGVESSFNIGKHLVIHPKSPPILLPSYSAEIALIKRSQARKIWEILYNNPTISYTLSYQTLGNQKILGNAISLIPAIHFQLLKKKKSSLQIRVGWGLGIITQKYNSLANPSNIVIGSHLNAAATLRAIFKYNITKKIQFLLGGGINHYSNGRIAIPNLGANIPFVQIGIQYHFKSTIIADSLSQKIIQSLPRLNQSIRPFVSLGLGLTEIGATQGVKYPIYTLSVGISRRMARISKLSLSFGYLYNKATYNFDKNNGGIRYQYFNYSRIAVAITHEFIFGHLGFVTTVGVYLNKHRFQRSIILSKIGFHLYLHNYFKKMKHQLWAGGYVRAYAGEAEFVEFVLGYNF